MITADSQLYESSVGPLREIARERIRQDALKAEGRFAHTLADNPGLDDMEKLYAILEEVTEAGKAIMNSRGLVTDGDGHGLRKEVIQIAALALAWLENPALSE